MQFSACRLEKLVLTAVLYCALWIVDASTITASPPYPTSSTLSTKSHTLNGTCEFRTINYITHNLPQICLRYSRSDTTYSTSPGLLFPTATETTGTDTKPPHSGTATDLADTTLSVDRTATSGADVDSALDGSSFLSFEDWKKQTLEKEGLQDSLVGDRRQAVKDGDRHRNPESIQDALKALEEDVVIDADFTAFLGNVHGESTLKKPNKDGKDHYDENPYQDVPNDHTTEERTIYRSKDAGKTWKERFNFASLDAGGQVMKTNPEAKSASALLKEDRDVYMLNTCQAKSKFLIVELSESILVETVAIANFEFFSSTFRQFRISVSDRYPVKSDRWVDLGTFEARNSREIQAFLVKDPRIWARYLRVEFLSHYGNEFYCPVSLLRIHGRTMIQDVLSMEETTRGEDDVEEDIEEPNFGGGQSSVEECVAVVLEGRRRVTDGLQGAEAAIEELVKTAEAITASKPEEGLNVSQMNEVKQWLENASMEQRMTPWIKPEPLLRILFNMSHSSNMCMPSEPPALPAILSQDSSIETEIPDGDTIIKEVVVTSTDFDVLLDSLLPTSTQAIVQNITRPGLSNLASSQNLSSIAYSSISSSLRQSPGAPTTNSNTTATGSIKAVNKFSTTLSSHSSQPTTQESFFKTVTKRLQLLEANSTLSLKYIEEQSRILRDAFTKVEKKQLAKTTSFLENLNDTVLNELRRFSQQYDQIWQSTVMELETQRDQSQQEIAAVSTRLSMLADELVFQKRMSIVQSVLLLLCLGLVIFSRGPAGGYFDMPNIQNMVTRSRNASDFPLDSASSSPTTQKGISMQEGRLWHGPEHRRQRSDDSAGSLRSRSRVDSPPTPLSSYSKPEEELEQDLGQREIVNKIPDSLAGAQSKKSDMLGVAAGSSESNWHDGEARREEAVSLGCYPDFKNSALWLSRDPLMSETEQADIQRYVQTQSGQGEQSPICDAYGSEVSRTATEHFNDGSPSGLPSPPPEREKPEFSIARKPLPALPRDDH